MFRLFARWPFYRKDSRPRILVIDDFVPIPSIGAGVPRAGQMLRALAATGAKVILWPVSDFRRAEHAPVTPDGVVISRDQRGGLRRFLAQRRGTFDCIIVSRPDNMRKFRQLLAEDPDLVGPAAIVYDAEAIFTEREVLKAMVLGAPLSAGEAKRRMDEELSLAAGTFSVLAVNEHNADMFRMAGHGDVRILRHAVALRPSARSFEQRDGFLFVGPTRVNDEPNSDAVIWFVDHVLPRLRRKIGRDGAPLVVARENLGLDILGEVSDLTDVYGRARVFVAATRFAAGIPIKVYEAAAHGIPTVITPLLAGHLGWADGREALVGDGPEAFAHACLRLHEDVTLWERIRANAMARVAEDCGAPRLDRAVADLVSAIKQRRQ
jgi:hypothetical protein